MTRLATSFVLGFHGCERSVAESVVNGDIGLLHSNRDFDWLGPGAYFWEGDPTRALGWAHWKAERGDFKWPAVVGAVIDLRNCLDLTTRHDLAVLRNAYDAFVKIQRKAGLPIPENRSVPGDPNEDRVLRFLDCAVIRHLHQAITAAPAGERAVEPYDTVRGMFRKGGPLYPGSGFHAKTHVQIAVCNNQCIKGIFHPRAANGEPIGGA